MRIRAAVLAIYALAMGHLEAVVVYYIRFALGDVEAKGTVPAALIRSFPWSLEQTREAATIVMLVAVAILAGRSLSERLAAFLAAFAIWDAVYYLSLKIMTQWPASLTTPDIYFLLPVPSGGPVFLPLLADLLMLGVAAAIMTRRERRPRLTASPS